MSARLPPPPQPDLRAPQQWDRADEGRADASPGTDQGADLGDFLRIITTHPFAVLLPLALTSGLAMAYLLVTKPTYNATTSVLIDARVKQSVGSDAGPALGFPDAALVESQVKLIASDVVLRRAVLAEKLTEDPEFTVGTPGLRDRLFSLIGLGPAASPGGDPLPNALSTLARAVTVKRSERTYVMDVEVALGDGQKAARVANAIAKAYIIDQQTAHSDAAKRDSDSLRVRLEDLQARVQEADTKVEAYKTQNKISDANGKLINEQQLLEVTTALGAAHARASEAKARYDQIQRLAVSGKLPDATADAVKSLTLDKLRAQSAEISRQEANLGATLGARHPAMIEVASQQREVRRLIAEELKRIADTATNEYQTAHAAELGLERQSDALKKANGATSQTLVPLRELQREADAQRSVYEKFLRTRETIKADSDEQPIARIIAPASASNVPSAPRRIAILSLAFAGGLALGLANALLAHAWGRRRRPAGIMPVTQVTASPPPMEIAAPRRRRLWGRRAQVPPAMPMPAASMPAAPVPPVSGVADRASATPEFAASPAGTAATARVEARRRAVGRDRRSNDIPDIIATLPQLRAPTAPGTRRRRSSAPAANPLTAMRDQPDSTFSDIIRAVLLHLRERPGEDSPQTIFVTAREPESGVSVLAAGLAFAAAQEGDRVLLIEANGAHPVLAGLVPEGTPATPIRLKGMQHSGFLLDTGGEGELLVVPMNDPEAENPVAQAPRMTRRRIAGIKNNFDFVVIDGATIGEDAATMMASAATDIIVADVDGDAPDAVSALCDDLEIPVQKFAGLVRMAAPEPAALATAVTGQGTSGRAA